MNIKFANEIVEDMNSRGRISVPEGYVTGEEFEKWMCAVVEQVDTQLQEYREKVAEPVGENHVR